MPKMKSKRWRRQAFKRTANGKVKRHHNYKDHILTKKTTKRKTETTQGRTGFPKPTWVV